MVERLRPVDLARAVGVSTQSVRDCEASGVVPPARWTESGQRRFGRRHLAALVAYRALASGMGVAAAGEVMRTLHTAGVDRALESVEAAYARAYEQRRAVREAARALAVVAAAVSEEGAAARESGDLLAGVRVPRAGSDALRIGRVARLVGVRPSTLRVWERAGLVVPVREAGTGYRVYGPEQVRDVRVVRELRRSGYGLEQIGPVMEELRGEGGGRGPLEALHRREEALRARARTLTEGVARLQEYLDLLARPEEV
ncbi:MerR family transcriptional regulator [Nocardiopsis sp. N85]|uniref:MerR family transcriptional regulator n=1 Tax=Nocardiopsis sp. N85 TaxID=3029400 RepID=UPI00237F7C99|nr:MerR family transcriptional regulator [Nocardiopsis sp. N85]MDE3722773.1 MerR family transcriptional regulator [Nocardiopsis sp. N85]